MTTIRTFINTGFRMASSFDQRQVIDDIHALDRGERPSTRPYLFEEADTTSVFEPGPSIGLHSAFDQELLATIWNVGNRMGLDANGLPWPRSTRSLSVGDVVQVNGTYYACAPVGWTELGEPPLVARAAWGEYDACIARDGSPDWRM